MPEVLETDVTTTQEKNTSTLTEEQKKKLENLKQNKAVKEDISLQRREPLTPQEQRHREIQAREEVSKYERMKIEKPVSDWSIDAVRGEYQKLREELSKNPHASQVVKDEVNRALQDIEQHARKRGIFEEEAELDIPSTPQRTLVDQLARRWLEASYGGTKVDVEFDQGITKITIEHPNDSMKIVKIPYSKTHEPVTFHQLQKAIVEVAPDLDGMQGKQTQLVAEEMQNMAILLSQEVDEQGNPIFSDKFIEDMYKTAVSIQKALPQTPGETVNRGQTFLSRSEIQQQEFVITDAAYADLFKRFPQERENMGQTYARLQEEQAEETLFALMGKDTSNNANTALQGSVYAQLLEEFTSPQELETWALEHRSDVMRMVVERATPTQEALDLASSHANFPQQLLEEFLPTLTNKEIAISFVEGAEVTVNRSEEKLEFILPTHIDLQVLATLARETAQGEDRDVVLQNAAAFGDQLTRAALLMGQSGRFMPDTVETMYRAGEQLQALAGKNIEQKSITNILTTARQTEFTPEERKQLILKVLYGKGTVLSGEGESGLRQTFYDRLYTRWQARHPEGNQEAFDQYLEDHNYFLKTLSTQMEKSLQFGETGRANIAEVAGQQLRESFLQTQMHDWLETMHNLQMKPDETLWQSIQSIHEELAKSRMERGSQTETDVEYIEEDIRAIVEMFQSPEKIGELIYAPADVLEQLKKDGPEPGEEHLWEMACNIKEAYLRSAFQRLGYQVDIPPIKEGHMIINLVKDGDVFKVDAGMMRGQAESVERITDTDRQAILDRLAQGEDGNARILSSLWHNAAMQLLEDGGDETVVRQMLAEALKLDATNVMALYGMYELTGDEYFLTKALEINPDIEEEWQRTKKKVGSTLTPTQFDDELIRLKLPPTFNRAAYSDDLVSDVMEDVYDKGSRGLIDIEYIRHQKDQLASNSSRPQAIDIRKKLANMEGSVMTISQKDFAKREAQQSRERAMMNKQRRENPTLFQLTPEKQDYIRRYGPLAWFERNYLDFAASWKSGKTPGGGNFDDFQAGLKDATAFIRDLRPEIDPITGDPYWDIAEKDTFKSLQDDIINSVLGVAKIQANDERAREEAKGRIESLGISGVERLKLLADGNVGAMMYAYLDYLETQRIMDNGFISPEHMNTVPLDIIDRFYAEALMGVGGFADRYQKIRTNILAEEIDAELEKIPDYPLTTDGKPDHSKFTQQQLDDARNNAEARLDELSQRQLQIDITGYFNIARWCAIDLFDESAVLSKGDPGTDGDYYEHFYLWNYYHDFVRYGLANKGQRDLFIGDQKKLGPHKIWVTQIVLRNMGIDPDLLSPEEFKWAADATYQYEFVSRSDRVKDSTWRMEPHLKYLYKELNGKIAPDIKNNDITLYSDLEFGLFTQLRLLTTRIDKDNTNVRNAREVLLGGKIGKFMPEKVMQQVYEYNFTNQDFVDFFSRHEWTFLDQIAQTTHYEYKPRSDTLDSRQELAHQRFEVFSKYFGPLMAQIRREGYMRTDANGNPTPIQTDFSNLDAASLDKINTFCQKLTNDTTTTFGTQFTNFMNQMSHTLRTSGIAHEAAYDLRYLPMYYRTIDDQDMLLNVDKYRTAFLTKLEATHKGASRLFGDYNDLDVAAKKTLYSFFKGDFNNQEEIMKAFVEACRAVANPKGEDGSADYMLKNAAFYIDAMTLDGIFEFFGWDMRVKGKSTAAQYLGPQIHSITYEDALHLFDQTLAPYVKGTSSDPDQAFRIERELMKKLGINSAAIWRRRIAKGILAYLVAFMIEMLNEAMPDELSAA